MSEPVVDRVPCRVCASSVRRDVAVCPSCGTTEPWIPDEPTMNPRLLKVIMCGGVVVLIGVLLSVAGVFMFAPADDDEPDHRPPAIRSWAHESR